MLLYMPSHISEYCYTPSHIFEYCYTPSYFFVYHYIFLHNIIRVIAFYHLLLSATMFYYISIHTISYLYMLLYIIPSHIFRKNYRRKQFITKKTKTRQNTHLLRFYVLTGLFHGFYLTDYFSSITAPTSSSCAFNWSASACSTLSSSKIGRASCRERV